MSTTQKYSKSSILMHGLTGLLILIMFGIGWFMAELPKEAPKTAALDLFDLGVYTMQFAEAMTPRTFYFNLHKSLGVTVLLLVFVRLYFRITNPVPAFPATMKAWEVQVADLVHKGLYVLMVVMPLAGIVMAINSKYGLMWFGIPLVSGLDNKDVRELFKEVHETLGAVFITVIVVHIAAAIKHKLIDKDEVMSRMSLR